MIDSPPTLWPSPHLRKAMALDARVTKLVYKQRLSLISRQVEKLSWMLEWAMGDENLAEAEDAWLAR